MIDRMARAAQFRRALQMFCSSLTDEAAMEVATIFPAWEVGKAYMIGERLTYGENGVGDPQLYQVLQDHTSAAEWTPNVAPSLYKAVGVTPEGYPEWSQPVGATDAYNLGDIVHHNDKLWICTAIGNVWEPGVYGWDEYEEAGA